MAHLPELMGSRCVIGKAGVCYVREEVHVRWSLRARQDQVANGFRVHCVDRASPRQDCANSFLVKLIEKVGVRARVGVGFQGGDDCSCGSCLCDLFLGDGVGSGEDRAGLCLGSLVNAGGVCVGGGQCYARRGGRLACRSVNGPEPGAGARWQAPRWQTPDGRLPDGRLPDGRLPDGRLPDGRLPDGRLPDGRLTDARLPDGRLPDGRLPVRSAWVMVTPSGAPA